MAAVVIGAVALAVDLTGSGAPSAFAAWTATTTTANFATGECRRKLQSLLRTNAQSLAA